MRRILLCVALLVVSAMPSFAEKGNKWTSDGAEYAVPTGTYKFGSRATLDLYLDYYKATPGSRTELDGHKKPAIIFAFGGGFIGGQRDKAHYRQWFKLLNDNGYPVFSIDYRLGLKGVNVKGVKMIGALRDAVDVGVQDAALATSWILEHADEFGVEADNLVLSGSSAGAIISLQTEYELRNNSALTRDLPDGFNYAGIMSFSGAIYSFDGKVKYAETPAPQLLMHGTSDKVVFYKGLKIFKIGLFGSHRTAKRLAKFGYPYTIVRYKDHTHDIADLMYYTFPEQLLFLEESVIRKTGRTVDISIDDPSVPTDNSLRNLKDLYKK